MLLTELPYLPPIAFFSSILADGEDEIHALLLDAHEHYRKQTYRNRALLLTVQGVKPLTVPVLDGNRSEKVRTADILLDYRENWPHQHFRTLQTAYGNSPYFSYYADYFHDLYAQKPARLWDLNLAFLQVLLRCLRLPAPLHFTTQYYAPGAQTPHSPIHPFTHSLIDRRDACSPKKPHPDTPAARPYPQLFGLPFVPGLSILDLLFMQGPQSGSYL